MEEKEDRKRENLALRRIAETSFSNRNTITSENSIFAATVYMFKFVIIKNMITSEKRIYSSHVKRTQRQSDVTRTCSVPNSLWHFRFSADILSLILSRFRTRCFIVILHQNWWDIRRFWGISREKQYASKQYERE